MRTVEKLWTLRASKRLVAMAAILLGAGTIILTSYALVIRARAEALRKDITTWKAGASTEAEFTYSLHLERPLEW